MKKCPKCKKTYDSSWEVCLGCSTGLVPVVPDAGVEDRSEAAGAKTVKKGAPGIKILAILFLFSGILGLVSLDYWMTVQRKVYDPLNEKSQGKVISRMPGAMPANIANVKALRSSPEEAKKISLLNDEVEKSNATRFVRIYYFISSIELILLGIGLLRKWELARKATIILMVLNVPASLFADFLAAKDVAIAAKKYYPEIGDILMRAIPRNMLVESISVILAAALFVWYFSRRHVKEAFCAAPGPVRIGSGRVAREIKVNVSGDVGREISPVRIDRRAFALPIFFAVLGVCSAGVGGYFVYIDLYINGPVFFENFFKDGVNPKWLMIMLPSWVGVVGGMLLVCKGLNNIDRLARQGKDQ